MRENRTVRGAELRATDGRLSGYASVFDSETTIGDFAEVVRPGAFRDCLATRPDVRALVNHNANLIIGRTKAKTLRLEEDSTGLQFDCDMPDTQTARDLLASIRRGDIDGCSFGFTVRRQRWTEKKRVDGGLLRELLAVDLFDVSVVTFPAYSATSVGVRSLWPQGIPPEVNLRCRVRDRISPGAGCYVLRCTANPGLLTPAGDGEFLERERALARLRLAMMD